MGDTTLIAGRRPEDRERTNGRLALDSLKLVEFSDTEAAYLAAIIDGEGSITEHHGRPVVYVYNTSEALMRWLSERIGGRYRVTDMRGRQPCHTWNVAAACDVAYLLRRVRPYLIIKGLLADAKLADLRAKYGENFGG